MTEEEASGREETGEAEEGTEERIKRERETRNRKRKQQGCKVKRRRRRRRNITENTRKEL